MKISMLSAAAVASALLVGALPAAAQDVATPSFYGNLGYSFIDGEGANFGAVTARIGARLHTYFGVEGEGAIGVDGDRETVGGVSVKTKVKHSFSGYAVGFLPVAPNFELLARGGYGTTKVKASALGFSASDSEESWNYGVGAQYTFDGVNGIRGDVTRHDFNNNGGKADVWTVTYVRKF